MRDEFGAERWRENGVREEDIAAEVSATERGGVNVLPVVDEDEELGVATGGAEMFHDLDSGAPGRRREVSHIVVFGNDGARCFVFDVGNDAGDEIAGLTIVDEGKVAGHDSDRPFGFEERGNDGVNNVGGSVKEHGSLGSDGKLVGDEWCFSLDKVL